MNELTFSFSIDSGNATLRPRIDGDDLLSRYRNHRGLHPDRLLPPLSTRLLPTRSPRSVLIGSCSCGETGCGSLGIRLRRVGARVRWEPDERSHDESLSVTYTFELTQYLDAVDAAADDRPGEGRGSRVAREVRLLLGLYDQSYDSLTLFQSAKVDWIEGWPWESNTVRVSITSAAGQQTREYHARAGESDRDFTARIAAELNDLRYGRNGTDEL